MEFLHEYESSSDSDFDNCELGPRQVRQVYLVTYSQADTTKFPTRKSFADAVVLSFCRGTTASIVHWCCSQEQHARFGVHYHFAIKLKKNQRWLPAKKFLQDTYGISVHFSNVHKNYYSAWRYVTKEDEDYEQSDPHPDLSSTGEPSTSKAHDAIKRKTKHGQRKKCTANSRGKAVRVSGASNSENTNQMPERKRQRLSSYDVSQIIISKKLPDRIALMAFANAQKREGKTELAEFVMNRGTKAVNELITNAWSMENAEATMRRREKSRMEILNEALETECSCKTHGAWQTCALVTLHNNDIPPWQFSSCVKELLLKGRGKYRNLMLTGPANCGKTFLLNPLNRIYRTFTNPASNTFAWVGAEDAEVVLLNDFRWSPQVIAWQDLLLLLEGQQVHLPAPKSHFAKDITFKGDTPIFCTTKRPLTYVKNGCVDYRETEMMTVRWKVFNLTKQIPESEQQNLEMCSSCYARLILEVEDS